MNLTFFDNDQFSDQTLIREQKRLRGYREHIASLRASGQLTEPESALTVWTDEMAVSTAKELQTSFKKVKHVVLLGIGGSSLGTEAVHSVLATAQHPELHVLDTVSAFELTRVLAVLSKVKKVEQVAVVVVSKSGTTTETTANAAVVLDALQQQFGARIYQQTVCIGDKGTSLLMAGKRLGAHVVPMPQSIGGRYSVFTSVGLVPLAMLGHDVDTLLQGLKDATTEPYEEAVVESAARLHLYLKKGVRAVNFFAFDTRLVRLGKWYRQLAAESLGKATTREGKDVKIGFVPTISTPVELHSVGQLYFSGFAGVYTDFVSFEDAEYGAEVPKKTKLAKSVKGKSLQDIAAAIYGGVIGAYQERELPYRSTEFGSDLGYALGLFMGMRMLETMYVAELMNVNAFDQPNVERYKQLTREILA